MSSRSMKTEVHKKTITRVCDSNISNCSKEYIVQNWEQFKFHQGASVSNLSGTVTHSGRWCITKNSSHRNQLQPVAVDDRTVEKTSRPDANPLPKTACPSLYNITRVAWGALLSPSPRAQTRETVVPRASSFGEPHSPGLAWKRSASIYHPYPLQYRPRGAMGCREAKLRKQRGGRAPREISEAGSRLLFLVTGI